MGKEADQNLNSPQSQESVPMQPNSLPVQPSLHLREPSPLPPREPSPLHREAPSPQPTSLEQRLQDSQDSGGVEKSRQKGRQSGRFRKSATTSSLAAAAAPQENQSRLLNSLVR